MSDLSPPEFHEDVYAHPLISWGAVIAGVVVAVALGALLNMLGLAIGATAANPWMMDSGDAKALTLGGGLWLAFSSAVALQVGGYIAARAAKSRPSQGPVPGLGGLGCGLRPGLRRSRLERRWRSARRGCGGHGLRHRR